MTLDLPSAAPGVWPDDPHWRTASRPSETFLATPTGDRPRPVSGLAHTWSRTPGRVGLAQSPRPCRRAPSEPSPAPVSRRPALDSCALRASPAACDRASGLMPSTIHQSAYGLRPSPAPASRRPGLSPSPYAPIGLRSSQRPAIERPASRPSPMRRSPYDLRPTRRVERPAVEPSHDRPRHRRAIEPYPRRASPVLSVASVERVEPSARQRRATGDRHSRRGPSIRKRSRRRGAISPLAPIADGAPAALCSPCDPLRHVFHRIWKKSKNEGESDAGNELPVHRRNVTFDAHFRN